MVDLATWNRMSIPEFENPELAAEYVQSLQDQVDNLRSRSDRQEQRIQRLTAERDQLIERLPRRKRPSPREKTKARHDRSLTIPSIGKIPDLELPDGPVARPELSVAGILDEFSDAAFRYEFSLSNLSLSGWRQTIESDPPDLLLIESAYRGVDGSWAGRIARFGRPDPEIESLVSWCRDHQIPTVFWVKEDPINHDWFIATAALFDWVLTVDSDMIETYRRKLGLAKVELMQFAAQPVIHHPGSAARTERVAFAGSFYAAKHAERRMQQEMLLSAAVPFGLDIFDRMDRADDPRFQWPPDLRPHVVGSLTYPQTLEAYRRYSTFLNVNTITGSPTMCARRIYELLASGTQVVSGPSMALSGVPVRIVNSPDEAAAELAEAVSSGPNTRGEEWVRDGNTMGHRVDRLVELVL